MQRHLNIGVVGLGYVGLVTATGLVTSGHRVRAYDANVERIDALRAGRLPITEPGVERLLRGPEGERFSVHHDLGDAIRDADVVLVAVGTDDGRGGWQTDTMDRALRAVAPLVRRGAVLAVRSTLPPQYVTHLAERVALIRGNRGIGVVLNPEFTREGTALNDFLHADRVVIGIADDPHGTALEIMEAVYAPIDAPIVVMRAVDASLAKLASNLFLATKISFANEIANLADLHGAQVDDVLKVVGLDPRIGASFMRPGVGFGGSCLPHQVTMTVREGEALGYSAPLIAAVDEVNRRQRQRPVDELLEHFGGSVRGRQVALLGLAFKPGTDDLREAPALDIARDLLDAGARVVATDPLAPTRERAAALAPGLEVCADVDQAVAGAEATILVTEWPEYSALDWRGIARRMAGSLVIDGRNALPPEAITDAGLIYRGYGRGGPPLGRRSGARTSVTNAHALPVGVELAATTLHRQERGAVGDTVPAS